MVDIKLSQITSGGAMVPSTDKVITVRGGTSDFQTTLGTAATHATGDFAQVANNLSDLASESAARTNLGLGSAATQSTSAFLQPGNNLSDVASTATARANLGLTTPEITLALASTTDLGTSASPNILINGAGTIAHFGSSASTSATDYAVRFNGTVTLTHSSSLVCPNAVNLPLVSGDYVRARYLGSGNWIILDVFQFGSGAVSGVSNSDGSLTISPTTGAVVGSLNTGHANTWSASQTFTSVAGTLVTLNNPNFPTTPSTEGWYLDTTNPGTGLAINGRVQIGEAVLNAFSKTAGTGSEWVEGLSNATTRIAQFASVSNISGIGVLGASRTSDHVSLGSQGTQGLTSIVNNDNTSIACSAYGLYVEAWKQSATAANGISQGAEIDCFNLGTTVVTDPYNVDPNGLTECMRVGTGKVAANNVSSGIAITANTANAKILRGLTVQWDAIASDSNSNSCAINLAQGHLLAWWISSGVIGPYIRSDVSTSNQGLRQIFANNTLNIQDPGTNNNLFGVVNSSGIGTAYINGVPLQQSVLVYQNTPQSIPSPSGAILTFNVADHDPLSIWNGSTTFTVPAGVTKVIVAAGLGYASGVQGSFNIKKNGSSFPGQPSSGNAAVGGFSSGNINSGVLIVTGGDTFTVGTAQSSGGSVNTSGGNTCWFSMEIIG